MLVDVGVFDPIFEGGGVGVQQMLCSSSSKDRTALRGVLGREGCLTERPPNSATSSAPLSSIITVDRLTVDAPVCFDRLILPGDCVGSTMEITEEGDDRGCGVIDSIDVIVVVLKDG